MLRDCRRANQTAGPAYLAAAPSSPYIYIYVYIYIERERERDIDIHT